MTNRITRITLRFTTLSGTVANVTQAANIARHLKLEIGTKITDGKYDCGITADQADLLADGAISCALGAVSWS